MLFATSQFAIVNKMADAIPTVRRFMSLYAVAVYRFPVTVKSCPIFTARCTLVQSAVLGSHVVRLSVYPSVTLVDCDHIGRKSCKLISRTISPTVPLPVPTRAGKWLRKKPRFLGF